MSLVTELLGRLLLGTPFVFGVFLGLYPLRYRHQRCGKLRGAHALEDLPGLGPERDLHPGRPLCHFHGQVLHRQLRVDVLRSMRRAHPPETDSARAIRDIFFAQLDPHPKGLIAVEHQRVAILGKALSLREEMRCRTLYVPRLERD